MPDPIAKLPRHDGRLSRGTRTIRQVATPATNSPVYDLESFAGEFDERSILNSQLAAVRAEVDAERRRYRELFDLNPDAYLVTNRSGVICEANLAAAALFGVPPQYLDNKPVAVYVVLDDRLVFRDAINRMTRIDQTDVTVRIAPRGAPQRIVYIRLSAVREEIGAPLSAIRWIIRDITQARRAEDEIANNRENLRELASELALAEERVRREIAVGIHDRVSQPLALVKILLGKIKLAAAPAQGREIDELTGLVQQAINESRTLTFELSPPVLYELGLPAAVEWLAEQIQRRHGVKIRTNSNDFIGTIPLEVRVLLFQSIRELLTNVIKHAKARSAFVALQTETGMTKVIVTDDGGGFDVAKSSSRPLEPGGFGLFSIRTRVERVGGRFLIESRRRHGTQVTLMVPIGAADPGQMGAGTHISPKAASK